MVGIKHLGKIIDVFKFLIGISLVSNVCNKLFENLNLLVYKM